MSDEYLDVYDDDLQFIGSVSRKEAHEKGYWHYTFHCWIILKTLTGYQVLLQKRHSSKEINPNTLSVSAAGHILSGEHIEDGVREIKEELGVPLSFSDLTFLGEYKSEVKTNNYHNKEIGQIYYTVQPLPFSLFTPQLNEVSGLYLIQLEDFYDLFYHKKEVVYASGYQISDDGAKIHISSPVSLNDFSSYELPYYEFVSKTLKEHFFK